jgi:hypothetical protein
MRTLFIGTITLIAIFAGAFYYVFYTPALILKAVPAAAEKYFKEGTVSSVSIGGQTFEYPEVLKLSKISAQVQWKDEDYLLEIGELDILNFQTFWRTQQQVIISVSGLNVQKKNFALKDCVVDATINLAGDVVSSYHIVLKNGEVNLTPYQLSGVQAKFEGTQDAVTVSDIIVQAYGGQAKGNIKIESKPHRTQTAIIEFSGLKSQELQTLNKAIFSQLTGEFQGTFRLTRADEQLQVLAILAEMSKGGTMEKNLCKKVMTYMTDEENRYAVETLLESKGKLSFDTAEFRILNVSQNLAGVTVTLINKKDNFRIHETINIDIARILEKIAWKS